MITAAESTVTHGPVDVRVTAETAELVGRGACIREADTDRVGGTDTSESKWVNGTGAGVDVYQISGHTAWPPPESSDTSNDIVPVLPAISNGCFGYIARLVTVSLSVTVSTT